MAQRGDVVYDGTTKTLYATEDPLLLVQYFKDDLPSGRDVSGPEGEGRGVVRNRVSSRVFGELERNGVRTHFVRRLSGREMLVRRTEMLPVVAVIRNHVAGSLVSRFDLEPGRRLPRPLCELYFKKPGDRAVMVNDGHCLVFGWLTRDELEEMRRIAFRVNEVLVGFFRAHGVCLVDFRLELGRSGGHICVADEVGPDSCRLSDPETGRLLAADSYGLAPGAGADHPLHWLLDDQAREGDR